MAVRRIRSVGRVVVYAVGAMAFAAITGYAQDIAKTPANTTFDQTAKPVLDRNCSGCHINGGHAGGLKLGSFAELMHGGEDGPIVEWGSPEKSMLSRAIHYGDDTLQMPPAKKMSDEDIAVVDKWIAQSSAPMLDAPPASATTPDAASASGPAVATATAAATPKEAHVLDASTASLSPQMTAEEEVFFETKVRPLLIANCYGCHASAGKGGLHLNSREGVLAGGKDGDVVVPGHPELSVLSSAVHYTNPRLQMPPRASMSSEDIAILDQWIKAGLPWPKEDPNAAVTKIGETDRNFWAFKAPVAPPVPDVKSEWAYNDIDKFVLAKLEEKHLKPVADADKRTMIRRVTYDLTGLPPTTAEVNAYLDDKSPRAYEKLVDRLLASHAYGERWGRIWLDVVRYADTSGGGGDYPIVQVSKYRDYVIKSFNEDKPYDRFIKEQIAGDLLPANSEDEHWKAIIATGYVANANRTDRAEVEDIVDNVGYAYLGLTVGCARCHDHKFDPIPQSDYYAMAGVFDSTQWPQPGDDNYRAQAGFTFRDPKAAESDAVKTFMAQLKPINAAIAGVQGLPGTYDDVLPQLEARRMNLYEHAPAWPEDAYAVSDGPVRLAQIQKHGDPKQLGDEVPRGFLQILGNATLDPNTKGSGRLELANWIATDKNPLSARVIVNRVWQGEFGRGIVSTPNNFGTRGMPPSNQALLDYLATHFVAEGWSIKKLQREILLSHAYQLSTKTEAANEEVDPDNEYIWRHTRVRLDAEEIRDSMLADSDTLDTSSPKPHPFPPQSQWNWEEQNPFVPKLVDYENNQRSVYMMVQRTVRNPYLSLFDGADPNISIDKRSESLTPLQALYFLDSPFPRKCADSLTAELQKSSPGKPLTEKAKIDAAFMRVLSRPATSDEEREATEFLAKAGTVYMKQSDTPEVAQQHAFSSLVQALFASNEFMFLE
jgi:mono/diheme cytochrome c family protein